MGIFDFLLFGENDANDFKKIKEEYNKKKEQEKWLKELVQEEYLRKEYLELERKKRFLENLHNAFYLKNESIDVLKAKLFVFIFFDLLKEEGINISFSFFVDNENRKFIYNGNDNILEDLDIIPENYFINQNVFGIIFHIQNFQLSFNDILSKRDFIFEYFQRLLKAFLQDKSVSIKINEINMKMKNGSFALEFVQEYEENNLSQNKNFTENFEINTCIKDINELFENKNIQNNNKEIPLFKCFSWIQENFVVELIFDFPKGLGIDCVKSIRQDIENMTKKTVLGVYGDQNRCILEIELKERLEGELIKFNDMNFENEYKIPIGKESLRKNDIYFDYSEGKAGHFFVVGKSGSGKSNWAIYFILSIMKHFNPNDAKIIIMQRSSDFSYFFKHESPHLLCPPAKNNQETLDLINIIEKELQRRKILFEENYFKNIYSFNRLCCINKFKTNNLPLKNILKLFNRITNWHTTSKHFV